MEFLIESGRSSRGNNKTIQFLRALFHLTENRCFPVKYLKNIFELVSQRFRIFCSPSPALRPFPRSLLFYRNIIPPEIVRCFPRNTNMRSDFSHVKINLFGPPAEGRWKVRSALGELPALTAIYAKFYYSQRWELFCELSGELIVVYCLEHPRLVPLVNVDLFSLFRWFERVT